jgi:hypothetical protein
VEPWKVCLALLKINRKRGHSSKCNGKGVCLHLPAASQQEVLGGGTSLITAFTRITSSGLKVNYLQLFVLQTLRASVVRL